MELCNCWSYWKCADWFSKKSSAKNALFCFNRCYFFIVEYRRLLSLIKGDYLSLRRSDTIGQFKISKKWMPAYQE